MTSYTAKMPLPDILEELMAEINGVAAVINTDSMLIDGFFEISFEEEDMYDLAVTVMNLQDAINSILGYMAVQIGKPAEVTA